MNSSTSRKKRRTATEAKPRKAATRDPNPDANLKALAGKYAAEALSTLANIMATGESEATRVAAARALLDRGFGKPVDVNGALDLATTMDRVIAEMREREERLRGVR